MKQPKDPLQQAALAYATRVAVCLAMYPLVGAFDVLHQSASAWNAYVAAMYAAAAVVMSPLFPPTDRP